MDEKYFSFRRTRRGELTCRGDRLSPNFFSVLSQPVVQCGAWLPIFTLMRYWTVLTAISFFSCLGLCSSVTLLIVVLRQYYVCCVRSGVSRSTHFLVLFLCLVCASAGYPRCLGRSSVCLIMLLLATELSSATGLLFPSRYLCGTIFLTLYSMCGTDGFNEQGLWFFIGLSKSLLLSSTIYSFSTF